MRPLLAFAAVLLLAGCGQGGLLAGDVIMDVDQTTFQPDSTYFETYAFNLPGSWTLQYGWDCTRQAEEGKVGLDRFSMSLVNADDMSLAAEHPVTSGQGRRGSGQFRVARPGLYELEIRTVCDWHARALLGAFAGNSASAGASQGALAGKRALDSVTPAAGTAGTRP